MNIGNLLYPLPENIKGLIRKIEKEIYKLNGLETAVIFNQIIIITIIIIIMQRSSDYIRAILALIQ